MTTADRIKNRRIELGLTQLAVAKRLGLTTKAAVCKVEKQGDDVTLKNVEKFAKALDCKPAYLMGWTNTPNYDASEIDNIDFVAENHKYNDSKNDTLTEKEMRFLETYSRLSEEQKKLVENMMKAFLEK